MATPDRQVRDHLLSVIASGALRPGDRLPTERDLCAALSVGRAAVRDALAVLAGEGRVLRRAGSGTYLAEPERSPPSPSPAQVMETRLFLEPRLAHLVAAHATAADLRHLQDCLAQGGEAPDLAGFEHWDAALHAAIARAAGNPLIAAAYDLITQARGRDDWGELKRRSMTPERRAQYQADHAAIVAALVRRDADSAEAAMLAHLHRVRSNLIGP
ncbi:MAG: FadR family transcriptional regulator [Paracoccaceae bacterium]|nr:MAG: FadR family transcriptional regulator [Paracoccaceae bacterium]